jgi:toxin YoeB
MNIKLSEEAEEDIHHWNSVDPAKTGRIVRLLENIAVTPFSGLGRPEPLKYDLQGYWSRRIDREHRLVYKVEDDMVIIASCRYHY